MTHSSPMKSTVKLSGSKKKGWTVDINSWLEPPYKKNNIDYLGYLPLTDEELKMLYKLIGEKL